MRYVPRALRAAVLAAAALLGTAACHPRSGPDAYGNMEATDVVVGAQTSGLLLRFDPVEGNRLAAGAAVALVDTTQLALQLQQAAAQHGAAAANESQARRQIDVLRVQQQIAQRSYERTERLVAKQAATAQQLDQAEREYRVLDEQIRAAQAQRAAAVQNAASSDARVAQLRDLIRRSHVTNPIGGTVLTTYVKAGEVVQAGQPLYEIADLDTLDLRAYVTEPQLAEVRLGGRALVSIDTGGGRRRTLTGRVSWIASQAEFTPTPIQTRDERANLVYAVKIRVPNEQGLLKIGMPADVRFEAAVPTEATAR